jgi:hypothetical protein
MLETPYHTPLNLRTPFFISSFTLNKQEDKPTKNDLSNLLNQFNH